MGPNFNMVTRLALDVVYVSVGGGRRDNSSTVDHGADVILHLNGVFGNRQSAITDGFDPS